MNILGRTVLPICLVVCGPSLALEAECNYTDNTTVKTAGTITSVRDFHSETANYHENHRVCVVKFDVEIDGTWQKAHDYYVFGPDLSENVACEKATEKAKVKALERFAPVHVNSQTQSVCTEITQPKERVVYIEKPVYVEKKIYVNRPIRTVRHVQRRVVHRSSNNNMPDPASCYLACVKGDCRCYSAMLAQRQRDNSLFGMNNGQLMGLFNWGTMLYGQFGRR